MIPTTSTIFGTLVLILDILVIVSVLTGRGSAAHKLLWILLILLLPVIGLVLYFVFGRSVTDRPLVP